MMAVLLAVLGFQAVDKVQIPDSKVSFDLVSIPGGTLKSGDREIVVRPYSIGAREVTWEEFRLYYERRRDMRVDGVTRPSSGIFDFLPQIPEEWFGAKFPVHSARWHTAMGYCAWLTKRTGQLYRLPTEAEWEFACRAEGDLPPLRDAAWGKADGGALREVGRKKPNAWGLHDMLGNFMEYCLEPREEGVYEPVLRGGAFNSPDAELSPSLRAAVKPEWYEGDPCRPRSIWWFTDAPWTGFRVVRVPDATLKDLESYRDGLEIRIEKTEFVKSRPGSGFPLVRVSGEVMNAGTRSLDELELTVHYVNSSGRPHHLDFTFPDHPIYGWCHPVMAGDRRLPLKPGERRSFEAEIANGLDAEDSAEAKRFGATVSGLRFSKE
jgi:hypothetical protein